jgi:hypothetical protein
MAVRVNRRVTLAARPVGAPQKSDFALGMLCGENHGRAVKVRAAT